jgi:hypothetical protein
MRGMKWIGLLTGILLIVSCFTPWVIIESKNITVSGIDAAGTNFGKPGYVHLLLAAFFIILTLINRLWAKRWNLLIGGLNLSWAIRNYFIIAACAAGECPEKQTGFYLIMLASVLMMISALFPGIEINKSSSSSK